MGRKSIAMLMVASVLGGFTFFGAIPRVLAQTNDQAPVMVGPTVQGEVTQKFSDDRGTTMIAVNGQPYVVPLGFYNLVDVGTVVQFDGTNWTIISGGI